MTRARFRRLRVLLTLTLCALLLALGAWHTLERRASDEAVAIDRARAVQRFIESRLRDDLANRAGLVAEDPAFAGYVEAAVGGALPGQPVDTASVVDLLRERESRLGFESSAVLDANGRILGGTSTLLAPGRVAAEDVVRAARDRDAATTGVWVERNQLHLVAVLPLAAVGVSDGFLLVSRSLGPEYTSALASVGVDGALVRNGATDLAVTTLAPSDAAPLAEALRDGRLPVRLGGRVLARERAFGSSAASVVLVPRMAAHPLQDALPWGIAVLLVGGTCAWATGWLARRVLRPAEVLVDRVARAGTGDLHVKVAARDAGELVELAAAFNRLMARLRGATSPG
ncbi:HAMP domain-containing protein [Lysobacter xanthus]